ncbi:hypothetical protein QYH69_07505 [Paraburkholderia sp. SARCC-3016]|uniref:hypothetical protein n=1 Tax=Paraburkholderia sp. SARCC-3016 TaxID=3058611 RepID=UPI00280A404E|nr:hypothetical protein [Paraburkholderia sp. SARCC-3016]MDQ7977090.1 hypothetical protein [Paraburkholderia sp. SARCC-3016]
MKDEVIQPPSRKGAAAAQRLRRRLPFAALFAALVAGVGFTQRHVMADEAHMAPPPAVKSDRSHVVL